MRTCTIDGCDKRHHAHGLCGTHARRRLKHGDASVRLTAPDGAGCITPNGYRLVSVVHPVARSGRAYEHRIVLYDALGPGTHPCHWCREPVTWGDTLTVDHLDGDGLNNDRANLVAACQPCNRDRMHAGNPEDWQHA